MLRRTIGLFCAACGIAACASTVGCVHSPPPATPPVPSGETADSAVRRPFVVADTDHDLHPDPLDLTRVRLVQLRWFLRDAMSRTGELPQSLDEVVPRMMTPLSKVEMLQDGWGRDLRFARSGRDFEIRSAGPDGSFMTADDVVVTGARLPPDW